MSLIFLLLSLLLINTEAASVYKAKKIGGDNKPTFSSPEEAKQYRLGRGDILTEGGFLKKGVWARMEGVIQATPEQVWQLFIQTNDWKSYKLPNLADSRALSAGIVAEVGADDRADHFYKTLGARVIDPVKDRRVGQVWTGYLFEYYNLPWPLSDRWMIIKADNDETKNLQGVYKADWLRVGGNIRSMEGHFSLIPFGADKKQTLLTYDVKSNPGSHVPRFILKWGLNNTMPATIRAIRNQVTRVYGRPLPILKSP